jgi:hypothetical protein
LNIETPQLKVLNMKISYFTSFATLFLSAPNVWGQTPTCGQTDIENLDVSNCACASDFPQPSKDLTCQTKPQTCSTNCNAPPAGPALSSSKLTQCGSGCVDDNKDCNGCYVWFHSLCSCIHDINKGNPTNCRSSPDITSGQSSPHPWVVTNQGDLITTTQLLPGILELQSADDPDGGFRLGQDTLRTGFPGQQYTRASGTLSMNSVVTRSEEQIHIHLCDTVSSKLRNILSGLTRSDYSDLKAIDSSTLAHNAALSCRASPSKGADVNVARDIAQHISKIQAGSCSLARIGAGVITDIHDYSWSCVTTGERAAESIFCYDP